MHDTNRLPPPDSDAGVAVSFLPAHGKIGPGYCTGQGSKMDTDEQPAPAEPADMSEAPAETPPEPEHEFLIPGPTPTSNEGCLAWGFSWVLMSIVLLLIVAVMSVGCFGISKLTGIL